MKHASPSLTRMGPNHDSAAGFVTEDPEPATVGAWMTPCPVVIEPAATLDQAELRMAEHAVRHLPVMDKGKAVGLLSDRDVAQVRALGAGAPRPVHVVEAMTPLPYVVSASTDLAEVAARMAAERYGSALVVEGAQERVVGIFTTVDALRALAALLSRVHRSAT